MDKKKAAIIAGLVVVFVLAIGAGLWSRGTADRAQEKLDLAVKYISENDFDKAILAYNDAINIDAKQLKAYQGLARVYTLQGKYDEAKAAYEKGVAAVAAGDQNTLMLGLAGMYIDKGQLPDAEKAFQELINGSQNCLEAYWGLAMVYQKQGDNTKAEAALKQAVAKYPNDYRGYNTLALFLKQNNKADDAFNNLVKSLNIEINQQEAYLVLSELYKGNWEKLRTKLIGLTDQKVFAMLEFYCYYASQDFQKALDTYQGKLATQSANHKARILFAITMLKTGDKNGSENLIKQIIGENINAWLYSDIAAYYFEAGNQDMARGYALRALKANGSNLDAVAILQKSNSSDNSAKLYAAEYLLYNWSPLGKAKEELQSRSLWVPVVNYQSSTQETAQNSVNEEQVLLHPVNIGNRIGYIDNTGQVVIAPQFGFKGGVHNKLERVFSEGLAPQVLPSNEPAAYEDEGREEDWGFIDKTGQWVIKPVYGEVGDFNEGLALAKVKGGKYGYIDRNGSWIIQPQFDDALTFNEGVAAVRFNGKWGFVDKRGQMVIPAVYTSAYPFSEGLACVMKWPETGFIDKNGNMVIKIPFNLGGEFHDGWVVLHIDNQFNLVNKNGQLLTPRYRLAQNFSEGLSAVDNGSKYGFIDSSGQVAIPLQYDGNGSFKCGLAPVKVGSKWGYINKSGQMVINPQYDSAGAFKDGLAEVGINKIYGYIDTTGKMVWQQP